GPSSRTARVGPCGLQAAIDPARGRARIGALVTAVVNEATIVEVVDPDEGRGVCVVGVHVAGHERARGAVAVGPGDAGEAEWARDHVTRKFDAATSALKGQQTRAFHA